MDNLPNIQVHENNIINKNKLHELTLNALKNWVSPELQEKIEEEIYGDNAGQNRETNFMYRDTAMQKLQNSSDLSYSDDKSVPNYCTGILKVEFKEKDIETSCVLLLDDKIEVFTILMNASSVIKKSRSGGMEYPKGIQLIVIDDDKKLQYEIPVKGFRVHAEYLNSDKFKPTFSIAVGFAKIAKSVPPFEEQKEFMSDFIEFSPKLVTNYIPKRRETLTLCWYPEDNANELMEKEVQIVKVAEGDQETLAVYYEKSKFEACQSGSPILRMNQYNDFEIVGLQLGNADNKSNVGLIFTPTLEIWVKESFNK